MSYRRSKSVEVLIFVAQIVLASIFLMAAYAKLAADPAMVGLFDRIGFGQWFRYFAAIMEIAGAAALVTRAWSAVGAVALAAIMLTAAILGVGYVSSSVWLWSVRMAGGFPFAPNILLIGCLAVAYLRRDQFERFAQ